MFDVRGSRYTRRGGSLGYFADFQHPKEALESAVPDGSHIDWASERKHWAGYGPEDSEIVATTQSGYGGRWQGEDGSGGYDPVLYTESQDGADADSETEADDGSSGRAADGWVSSAFSGRAGSVANHLGGDGWERSGPNAFTAPDPRCKSPRYCWHLGCILLKMPAISLSTGDDFLEQISGWVGALPPAPVSVEWDEDDPEVVERLLAALWRDGAAVLTGAVPPELCDAVLSEMEPCTPPAPSPAWPAARITPRVLACPQTWRRLDRRLEGRLPAKAARR